MRRFAAFMILTCSFIALAQPALADRRVALVIGNSAYTGAPPLKNPRTDAQDMAQALKRVGFDVTLLTDATRQQMELALHDFEYRLRQGGTGLFYFAGHGVQIDGENYLLPVNAVIHSAADVKYGALAAGLVLGKMDDAGNGMNIIILDACRNNPFARSFRSAGQGLAKMDAPTGSILAYATAPGSVASDGEGRNGVYTRNLLSNLSVPGLTVEEVFKNVRKGVVLETIKKQVPWESSSLIGQFYFLPPTSERIQLKNEISSKASGGEKKVIPAHVAAVDMGMNELGLQLRPAGRSKLGKFFHADPNYGVEIVDVARNSLSAEVDLLPGDVILQVNQRRVTSVEQFNHAMDTDAKERGVAVLIIKRRGANLMRSIQVP